MPRNFQESSAPQAETDFASMRPRQMPRNFVLSRLMPKARLESFNEAAADAAEFSGALTRPMPDEDGFNEAAADAAEFFRAPAPPGFGVHASMRPRQMPRNFITVEICCAIGSLMLQ